MNKFDRACTYAYVHGRSAMNNMCEKIKQRTNEYVHDESGMEIIAIVLILVVVIALVIVFKDKIAALFNSIWGKIDEDSSSALDTTPITGS